MGGNILLLVLGKSPRCPAVPGSEQADLCLLGMKAGQYGLSLNEVVVHRACGASQVLKEGALQDGREDKRTNTQGL